MTLKEWAADPRSQRPWGILKASLEDMASGKAFKRPTVASGEQEASTTKGRSRNELQALATMLGLPKGGTALKLTDRIKKAAVARLRARALVADATIDEAQRAKFLTLPKDEPLALSRDIHGRPPITGAREQTATQILSRSEAEPGGAGAPLGSATHFRAIQQAIEREGTIRSCAGGLPAARRRPGRWGQRAGASRRLRR
jgi:hypothetical protein